MLKTPAAPTGGRPAQGTEGDGHDDAVDGPARDNLPGPDVRLSFLAAPIVEVIPVSSITGNVTVAFAVLSYAGSLAVTVVADPLRCPDLPILVTRLRSELDMLATGPAPGPARPEPDHRVLPVERP